MGGEMTITYELNGSPTVDAVRSGVRVFSESPLPDRSYEVLRAATGRQIDLARPDHRHALHRWLNAWGCRIRVARAGEADPFDVAIESWWERDGGALRAIRKPLAELTDRDLQRLGATFDSLNVSIVAFDKNGKSRSLGPTAAAKALYALRPRSVMPWDLAIASQLHGARDGAAFTNHLVLGRQWANSLLQESGLDETDLVAALGRPGSTLARVLDEYCFVRYTLGR
jgi:hypothetical protein